MPLQEQKATAKSGGATVTSDARLGTEYLAAREYRKAARHLKRAVAGEPENADLYYAYGYCLTMLDRSWEARESFLRALKINPDHAESHHRLGQLEIHDPERQEEGLSHLVRSAQLARDSNEIYRDISDALLTICAAKQAARRFETLLTSLPDRLAAKISFASRLGMTGDIEEARQIFEQVVEQDPQNVEAWNALGHCAVELRDFEAVARYRRRALEADPDHCMTLRHYISDCLRMSDFRTAREVYRRHVDSLAFFVPHRERIAPAWDGAQSLEGKTVLLHAENIGLGDTLQFCRFAADFQARGARVWLRAPGKIAAVLKGVPGVESAFDEGTQLPDSSIDFENDLFSVWFMFDVEPEHLSRYVPYCGVASSEARRWRGIIGEEGYRVGLVWRGSPQYSESPRTNRSLPFIKLAPVGAIPGVVLYSLQFAALPGELASWPGPSPVLDLPQKNQSFSFSDMAGAMQALDVIVTIDTAAAHLAGSLGKKTYLLLPYSTDWRWLVDREDSPWYPTMRIFRQTHPGAWDGVIAALVRAIERDISGSRETRSQP